MMSLSHSQNAVSIKRRWVIFLEPCLTPNAILHSVPGTITGTEYPQRSHSCRCELLQSHSTSLHIYRGKELPSCRAIRPSGHAASTKPATSVCRRIRRRARTRPCRTSRGRKTVIWGMIRVSAVFSPPQRQWSLCFCVGDFKESSRAKDGPRPKTVVLGWTRRGTKTETVSLVDMKGGELRELPSEPGRQGSFDVLVRRSRHICSSFSLVFLFPTVPTLPTPHPSRNPPQPFSFS